MRTDLLEGIFSPIIIPLDKNTNIYAKKALQYPTAE